MGRIQTAYTFDPTFHRELEAKLVTDNQLHLEVLHDLATAIAANLREETQEVLDLLRFDPEWLDPPTEELINVDRWYMVVFADHLIPAPSLSNRCPVSHLVLQYVLPLLGWSHEEVRWLLYGDLLHGILKEFASPPLLSELWTIDQFGGWLSLEIVAKLLSHLVLVEDFFPSAALEARKDITDLAGWWARRPSELLSQAYADAREMLEAAITRNQPLYLLLDS